MSNRDRPELLRRAFRDGQQRDLFDQLIEHGWACKRLGTGHIRCVPPSGGQHVAVLSSTDSGGRGNRNLKNNQAVLKRWLREQGGTP